MNTLYLKNVSKSFRDNVVLENINLKLNQGEIVGVVGENGCGKSVLMKLMVGLMKPTEGEVYYNQTLLGKDIDFLPSVGAIINKPGFFDEFDGLTNLKMIRDIKNIISDKEVLAYFHKVGLNDLHKHVKDYSTGMKQRLAIAQAIMEDPEVLILDEFSSGLDEEGLRMIYGILREEKAKGKIIFISSHIKEDISSLCDRTYRLRNCNLESLI